MATTLTAETLPLVAPKSQIERHPALSDIFSASEDEQDEEDRNEQTPHMLQEVDSNRQAPPTEKVQASANEWVCMRDLLSVNENKDNIYEWCGSPFCSTEEQKSSSVHITNFDPEKNTTPIASSTTVVFELDDHKTTGQLEDNESLNSFSTLGNRIFGNLSYLPSTSRAPSNQGGDNSTVASVGDLSTLSGKSHQDMMKANSGDIMTWDDAATFASENTMATEKLEMAIEEKLRQVDADKTIGDTKQSVVELIRTSSSASARSFKRKKNPRPVDTECEQSALSGQSSYANSALSPRSISKRTDTVRELKSAIETFGRFDVRCANIACALGDMYLEEGEYQQAFKLYREATMIYSTKLGDHHTTTIDSKVRLGKVLEKTGEHDRAIDLYFHALSMRKAILGDQDASIPHTLVCIASALKRKGRATQAIKELKRALKLYRTVLGDSHPCVTATVDEISALYVIVGDYTKATAILEEVVKLKAATLGLNHDDVAKTLLELASAYDAAGDNAKALRSLKKCYSIQTTIHGDSSDEATIALERIAQNYKKNKDSERSVAAYLGVLRGRKDHHGDTHPIVADTYLQLGIALRENNQPDKAMKCMKQALSIYVGKGKDMNDVGMIAEVMHEMALIHRSKGQLADALKIFKQELAIREKMGDRERYQVAITLHHIGVAELELKNNTKALNFFMEALAMFEKISDQVGADFAETLYCTGIVFEASRHQERAEEAYEESIKMFQSLGYSDKEIDGVISKLDKLKAPGASERSKRGSRSRQLTAL